MNAEIVLTIAGLNGVGISSKAVMSDGLKDLPYPQRLETVRAAVLDVFRLALQEALEKKLFSD